MTTSTQAAMNARLVRYADLIPCRTAFLDTKTPGSTEKENFTIIGAGVSESADQHVHITEKHGFNIGAARQPFGCINSQHSHDTAEVFMIHSGRWRLLFGANKEDGALEIGPGDVASVPIHMFRGFEKIDDGVGFLFTILGEDDPGKVTWAPAVFEAAADHGLKLAKGGRLIDTSQGDYALKDVELEDVLDADSVAGLKTPPIEKILECVVPYGSAKANAKSPLAAEGVEEAGIIVPQATGDGFAAGPIKGWWPHGCNLRQLTLQTGAYVPHHARAEAEVLIVQEGTFEVSWADGAIVMGAGDMLTVPIGLPRAFRNTASVPAVVFVVRGTESPAMPVFG
ncbi:cupin domain-containing protein [Sphingomonas glacialis]|uniref:Cupin domain-containing protein n=1 Tax=Sphingomonas glacialis TaxID=658225 RepID=A0A502FFZ7_9SPHN|nr:cupin domain-containing protein [Sphingomonas glacialis]TPG48370.1 cupin domain-containing protein [Sphingomonas glacialis]